MFFFEEWNNGVECVDDVFVHILAGVFIASTDVIGFDEFGDELANRHGDLIVFENRLECGFADATEKFSSLESDSIEYVLKSKKFCKFLYRKMIFLMITEVTSTLFQIDHNTAIRLVNS